MQPVESQDPHLAEPLTRGTPDLGPVIAKYGHALSPTQWSGLPMRVGSFPGSGRVEGLYTDSDAVLVWSGGTTDVDISWRMDTGERSRNRFTRHSGMVDLLPAGTTLHEVVWTGDESSCVSVNLTKDLIERWSPGAHRGLPTQGGPRFNLPEAHIVDLVRRLLAQAMLDEPLGADYVRGLSLTLASYVFATFGAASAGSATPLPELTSEKLVVFVEEHLAMNLGLGDLAKIAGYSPDHFARLFKRSFGMTPHHYIVHRRVERAKAMLRDPRHSLARVAAACGFSTGAHFSQVFKRQVGMTPSAYRKG